MTSTTSPAPTQTITVFVPLTLGVILGSAYYGPWLAEDPIEAARLGRPDGQPVFTNEADAYTWVEHFSARQPLLGPWTVEERTARVVTYTDKSTRLFLR